MNDLFGDVRDRVPKCTIAARILLLTVLSDAAITRAILNDAMTSAFGGSDAAGRWTQRESLEVLEHGIILAARTRMTPAAPDVVEASALLDRLPTQTVRSKEQVAWQ